MAARRHCLVTLWGVVAVVVLGILVACGERAAPGPAVGERFPEVALARLGGNGVFSRDALRGKVLVVNFWATWCEPCRREMPSLERLHRQSDPAKLAVIGVSVDTDTHLAHEFLLQYGLTFANFTDREQKLARDQLRLQSFPTTYMIAADGTIKARIDGARDWSSPETLRMLAQWSNTP